MKSILWNTKFLCQAGAVAIWLKHISVVESSAGHQLPSCSITPLKEKRNRNSNRKHLNTHLIQRGLWRMRESHFLTGCHIVNGHYRQTLKFVYQIEKVRLVDCHRSSNQKIQNSTVRGSDQLQRRRKEKFIPRGCPLLAKVYKFWGRYITGWYI